jgi:sialidase-1
MDATITLFSPPSLFFSMQRRRKVGIHGLAIVALMLAAGAAAFFLIQGVSTPTYTIAPGVTSAQDLFVAGTEGYNTFRIPALIALPNNVVIAFCEGRVNSASDYGDIDMVCRRSTDGGQTWGSLLVLWNNGTTAIQNPTPVYDAVTQTLLLAVTRNRQDLYILNSTDEGQTWTAPKFIPNVREPGWDQCVTGPGHAIQLSSGRLLLPAVHYDGKEWNSHVIYSDDNGATWNFGAVFTMGNDECTALQCVNGSVYLNCRQNDGANARMVTWSNDGGQTFGPTRIDKTLLEPVCEGSVIRFTDNTTYGTNRVLFCNPVFIYREKLTLRISYDECNTWPVTRAIYLGPSGYSDLAVIQNKTICVLFERGQKSPIEEITFVQVSLAWLTYGQDTLDPR